MHRTKDNFNYLTTAPVPKVIMTLVAPTIVSMLVTSFYNIADTYFVGKINTQSTAAVGIVFSVIFIPLIMILPYYLGLQGVEMCQAVADMLTFVLAIPLTGSVLLEMKRKETGR